MVAKYILTDYISQSQSVQKHAFFIAGYKKSTSQLLKSYNFL